MTDDDLAAIEAVYEKWSPDWRELIPGTAALLAEVKASRERERRLRAGVEAIAARRCLCAGGPPHGGPCCGVAGGRCVTCEARAMLDDTEVKDGYDPEYYGYPEDGPEDDDG